MALSVHRYEIQLLYPDTAKQMCDVKCISQNTQTRPPLVAQYKELVNFINGFLPCTTFAKTGHGPHCSQLVDSDVLCIVCVD
jgi:hypothetical protein